MLFTSHRPIKILRCCIVVAVAAFLCLSIAACARKDYGTLKQNTDVRTQQQIYMDLHAPLQAGHKLLEELLPQAKAETYVFELSASGANLIKRAIHQDDLWNEQLAIFLKTPRVSDDTQYDWFYFEPDSMRIQMLDLSVDGEQKNRNIITLLRSVPVSRKPTFTQNELDVFRFTFTDDKNQGLRFKQQQRISNHLGNNIMPLYLPKQDLVVYTSVDSQDQKHIMQVSLAGIDEQQAPKLAALPLIANPAIQSSHPQLLSDGSLGIIANPDGYFRAYEYNFTSNSYQATSKAAAAASNGDLVLSALNAEDAPLILQIPKRLDLQTLLGLVEAHNTSVNRYRALLAAALIEARRSKLDVLPTLRFGVYYTPVSNVANGNTAASGDFLAEGISRGLLGIVQDLLSIPKHLAMSEAQLIRAEIARDTLLDEINQRQAEVADLFFQAQMYQQLLDIDKTLLDVVRQQQERQQHLKQHGAAISAEVMAYSTNVVAVEKRLEDHQRRFILLLNEIKDLCSIPRQKNIDLDTEIYLFEQDKVEQFNELKQMALLNNPRIQAARLQLDKAFFEQKTGSRFSPKLSAGAQYGRSHDEFGEFLDEYITLNINGEIPLGAFKDNKLQQNYAQEINTSLRLSQEQQSQTILRTLQLNLDLFYESKNKFEVQQQHLAHSLEQIRLARIFKRYPYVQTAYRQQSKDLPSARESYYQALTETLRQHAALAQYYTRVWRDMGLTKQLPQRLMPIRRDIANKSRFSTWVWSGQELLNKDNAIESFIRAAKEHHIRRAYVYLEADDKVLSDPLMSERLTMLINKGAALDIKIWALVGSKEKQDHLLDSQLQNSVRNIEQYNQRFKALEPRIAGMKIHLQQGASTDTAERTQYQNVLEQTRSLLPKDLPLWIDMPMDAFTEDNAAYIRDVIHLVDGVTVYNPNGKNQELLLQSDALLEISPAAVEFALQRSADNDGNALNEAIRTLQKNHLNVHKFAGIALLDWSQILRADDEAQE